MYTTGKSYFPNVNMNPVNPTIKRKRDSVTLQNLRDSGNDNHERVRQKLQEGYKNITGFKPIRKYQTQQGTNTVNNAALTRSTRLNQQPTTSVANQTAKPGFMGFFRNFLTSFRNPTEELGAAEDTESDIEEETGDNTEENIYYNGPLTPRLSQLYKEIKLLGSGTYGKVWLAEFRQDPTIRVAIKIVKLIEDTEYGIDQSTLTEVSLLTRLNHPNVIRLYDVDYDLDRNLMGLVLELADTDLANLIRNVWFKPGMRQRKQDQDQLQHQLQIAYDSFCGLNYLHRNNIIHLDLKPQNILIVGNHAKIADFGISDRSDSFKVTDLSKSTWWYRPPEIQCESGKYDYNADTWSMGVILVEMFFDERIFSNYNNTNFDESKLFDTIVKKIGTPSANWINEYRRSMEYCPTSNTIVTAKSIYKSIESAIFRNNNDRRRYYKHEYYGTVIYGQILDLISQCLRFEPQERIQFSQVLIHPLFENAQCNCRYCKIAAQGYHISQSQASALDSTLESIVSFSQNRNIIPYGREIYRRFALTDNAANNINSDIDQLKYQVAALSLASKLLNVPDDRLDRYRKQWARLTGLSTLSELNNLELSIGIALGWNLDGEI